MGPGGGERLELGGPPGRRGGKPAPAFGRAVGQLRFEDRPCPCVEAERGRILGIFRQQLLGDSGQQELTSGVARRWSHASNRRAALQQLHRGERPRQPHEIASIEPQHISSLALMSRYSHGAACFAMADGRSAASAGTGAVASRSTGVSLDRERRMGRERLRIAQVAPLAEAVPPKLYGGTERVIWWLTEALADLGHDVTLYASGDSTPSARLVSCADTGPRLRSEERRVGKGCVRTCTSRGSPDH